MNLWRLIAAAALASALCAAAQQNFEWHGSVAAGQSLEIKGVNGRIVASDASGKEIEVTAEKRGSRSSPDTVQIEVVPHSGGVTICAVYPDTSSGRPNECRPGDAGRMSVRENDVKVDFVVHVPKGVDFVGKTVNGSVEVDSLTSDVVAKTVNGRIRVDTSGSVEATTVNGDVEAAMGSTAWNGDREFTTVNGGITLRLPNDASTDISARTVNGGIESDFPLTVRGRFGARALDGTIGGGGRQLKLKTVNGSIRLRRIS